MTIELETCDKKKYIEGSPSVELASDMLGWLKKHWQDLALGAGILALSEGLNITDIFPNDEFHELFAESGISLKNPIFDFTTEDNWFRIVPRFNNPFEEVFGFHDNNQDYLDDNSGKLATDMRIYDQNNDGKIDYGRFQGEELNKFYGTLDKPLVDKNEDYLDDRTGKVSNDIHVYDINKDGKFDYGKFQDQYIDFDGDGKADSTVNDINIKPVKVIYNSPELLHPSTWIRFLHEHDGVISQLEWDDYVKSVQEQIDLGLSD